MSGQHAAQNRVECVETKVTDVMKPIQERNTVVPKMYLEEAIYVSTQDELLVLFQILPFVTKVQ